MGSTISYDKSDSKTRISTDLQNACAHMPTIGSFIIGRLTHMPTSLLLLSKKYFWWLPRSQCCLFVLILGWMASGLLVAVIGARLQSSRLNWSENRTIDGLVLCQQELIYMFNQDSCFTLDFWIYFWKKTLFF